MNIKEYIKKLGIIIREAEVPIARTFFDEQRKKFIIEVNTAYVEEPFVFEHELLHIYRGDLCLEGVDAFLWNVASDIVINRILIHRIPKELQGQIFMSCPCGFQEWRSGARVLYEHLLTHHTQIETPNCFLPTNDEGARKEAERIKRRILQDYENAEIPEDIEEYITKRAREEAERRREQKGKGNAEFSIVLPSPKSNPILSRIKKYILDREGESEFLRKSELFRNNRNPFIKRELEIPDFASILFIVDISGSMNTFINDILAAIRYFEREITIEKIFFSDDVKYSTSKKYYNAGGGTLFIPVFRFLEKRKKRYSLICLFSDYEFFDIDREQAIRELRKYTKKLLLFDENLNLKEVKANES